MTILAVMMHAQSDYFNTVLEITDKEKRKEKKTLVPVLGLRLARVAAVLAQLNGIFILKYFLALKHFFANMYKYMSENPCMYICMYTYKYIQYIHRHTYMSCFSLKSRQA